MTDGTVIDALRAVARRHDHLDLLVLFGSRGRGDAHEGSDWDFGYLGNPDAFGLLDELSAVLETNAVDVVNLDTVSGLLRYQAVRDANMLLESREGLFTEFAIDVAIYWCDVEPVVRQAHEEMLAGLSGCSPATLSSPLSSARPWRALPDSGI